MALKEETYNLYCRIASEWLVNGKNGVKAVLSVIPNKSINAADKYWQRVYGNVQISTFIKNKQNKTSNKLQITLERQVLELEDLKKLSKEDNKFNDAINALKEQSKLLGFYEKDNGQSKAETTNIINLGKGNDPNDKPTI